MGFTSQRLRTVGLCALLGILFPVYSNGQAKQAPQYVTQYNVQPIRQSEEQLPPIFNRPAQGIDNENKYPQLSTAYDGLDAKALDTADIPSTSAPAADILVIEPGVPEFTSKSDAGKYVANQLGILSLYAKTQVGNSWKLNRDAKVRTSIGLRNLTEPRIQFTIEDIAHSGFNIKASSTLRKPAEASLYMRVDGGEIGIYGTLEREGDVRAYIGIQANSLRLFNRLKYALERQ